MDSVLALKRYPACPIGRSAVRRSGRHQPARCAVVAQPGAALCDPLPGWKHARQSRSPYQEELALGGDLDCADDAGISWTICLGRTPLRQSIRTSARRPRDLCRRPAMDVEGPARGRRARDQRAAYPGRPRGPAHHVIAGRNPFVLHSGVPYQTRRVAGNVPNHMVQAAKRRRLSIVLCGILRHGSFADARPDRCDAAARIRALAVAAGGQRNSRRGRQGAVQAVRLQRMSWHRCRGARAAARRPVWPASAAVRWHDRDRRRPLHP